MSPKETDSGPDKKQVTLYANVELYDAAKKIGANMSELLNIALAAYLNMESPDLILLEEKQLRSQNAYNAVVHSIQEKEQVKRDAVQAKEERERTLLEKVYAECMKLSANARNRISREIAEGKTSESNLDYLISQLEKRIGYSYNDVNDAVRALSKNGWQL